MVTVGSRFSRLMTTTETAGDFVTLPAASRPSATSVCAPATTSRVSQLSRYGADVSAPMMVPSTRNLTDVIASEAFAVRVTMPVTSARLAGDVMLTVGGALDGGGTGERSTVTVTGGEIATRPFSSRASTRSS